jgi:two-component system response regulator RegX3
MTKILMIEDEASFSEAITFLLKKEGFEVAVANNGQDGINLFDKSGADLILLDLMLPGLSGTEIDKVVGLELGADDYVTKPYSSRELIARINAVLRRASTPQPEEVNGVIAIGPIKLDIDRHIMTLNNMPVQLPLKEFELLEFLMRNSGRVLTRSQLIDRVWGSDYFGDTKTLDVHVKRLRAKIEKDPANPIYIQTVRGLGYKFEG